MHILPIHYIFSVWSKCRFPAWVEKVIYQDRPSQNESPSVTCLERKMENVLSLTLCHFCSILVILRRKLLILAPSIWVFHGQNQMNFNSKHNFLHFLPSRTARQLSLFQHHEFFFNFLFQLVNLKSCKHITSGKCSKMQHLSNRAFVIFFFSPTTLPITGISKYHMEISCVIDSSW